MKKTLQCALLLFVTLCLITGCSSTNKISKVSSKAKGDVTVLKLGHVLPETEIQAQGAKKFAEEVSKLTNGKLKIELFPGGTLGKDKDLVDGLKVGTVDIWLGGSGVLSSSSKTANIYTVPFMFNSQESFDKVYNGAIGEEISKKVEKESGYKVISYWTRGSRWLTSNKSVSKPSDLKGLKIRVPESPVYVKSWNQLGASPTPMEFGQVFTSLQQKVIDGQENPLSLIYTSKFNEVNKFLIKTEHVREPIALVMSSTKFNSLSPDFQKVLIKASNGEAKTYIAEEVKKGDEEFLKKLQNEGMTLVQPDVAAFQDKLKGFVDKEFPEVKDIYAKVVNQK